MFITLDNLNIHYKTSGTGKNIVLLHGWGANLDSFASVQCVLEKQFQVYAIDLPGFGRSDTPVNAWGTAEYANLVRQFLHALNIENPILIGHSFGGRLAIRVATMEKVHKLILVDSAGIRPHRSGQYYFKVYSYKLLKRLANLPILRNYLHHTVEMVKKKAGSTDYQNAAGVMRDILVKVVNEDLRAFLPRISVPTLLIWGENDTATPVTDGHMMEKLLPDAGLVILKNAGHFSYLDKLNEFLVIITHFLQEDARP